MRKQVASIAVVASLLCGSATSVRAQAKCSDLPSAQQAKCNAEVARKCSGVTGYWPKRRCEEGVAGSMNPCGDEKNVKACQVLRRDYEQVCRGLGGAVHGSGSALKEWLDAIKALPAVLKRVKDYEPVAKACEGKIRCNFRMRELNECKTAAGNAKTAWAAHLKRFVNESLKTDWGHVASYEKGKQWADAGAKVESMIAEINKKLEVNKTPEIRGDDGALRAELAKLKAKQKEMGAKAEAALASERCPAKGRGGGKLVDMILEHFKRHNPNVKETVKRFNLVGKTTKTYRGVAKNIVREHRDGVACVHRVRENKQADCFYIYVAFSRQKHVREKKWGDWIIERFMNSTPMLCRNLR